MSLAHTPLRSIKLLALAVATTGFTTAALAGPGDEKAGKGQGGKGNMDPVQMAQKMISEFDRDGDRALNAAELAAMMQQMRERRGQQGQAGQQGRRGPGQGAGQGRQGRRGGPGAGGAGRPQRPQNNAT